MLKTPPKGKIINIEKAKFDITYIFKLSEKNQLQCENKSNIGDQWTRYMLSFDSGSDHRRDRAVPD